jgi:hypothetical protein
MIEASPTKYYFAKYFFLCFACLQGLVGIVILLSHVFGARSFFTALIFFTLALIFLFIFMLINDKIRRVAVGKNKIIIIEGQRNLRFDWPEVKSLKIIPYFNLYKLKLRGKKGCIYFFPSSNIDPTYGILYKDTTKMGDIVSKRKKEFGIK